jgi:FkbM family methyltransferase
MMNWKACGVLWVMLTVIIVLTSLSGQSFVEGSNSDGGDITAQSPLVEPPTNPPRITEEPEDPSPAPTTSAHKPPSGPLPDQIVLFDGTEVITHLKGEECIAEYERVVNDPNRFTMSVPPIGMFREHLNAIQAHILLRTECYALLRKRYKNKQPGGKNILIDMGSRMADSVTHFLAHYPGAKSFDIHCFEANSAFNSYYNEPSLRHVHYYNYAVSTINSTMYLSESDVGSSIVVAHSEGKQKAVNTINWNEFALRHFNPNDHVIVKMDIEKAEFAVLHLLLKSFAFLLIDDLLLECHCTTYQPPPRPLSMAKEIGRDECKKISRDFNEFGMTSVDWSKRRTAADYARKHGKWYPT